MAKKRKRKKSNRVTSKNITKKFVVSCSFLILLLLLISGISYYLFGTSVLDLDIHKTANNISFNDIYDSDTIKINNLRQLNDKKGKKSKAIDLNISGVSDGLEYEIILIPINVNVEYKYVKYYLTDENNNSLVFNNLSNSSLSNDYSGNVIYSGVLNNKKSKLKLRVWIDDNYNEEIGYNLFEVKFKLK